MFDPYIALIGGSVMILLSYVFDLASRKFKIPSVLFLIATGMGLKFLATSFGINLDRQFFSVLELLGIVGLIMIVLEAAVDLKLTREKLYTIKRSALMATLILVISSLAIALVIMYFRQEPFFNSLVYAIPLSVVSSAVLIPSVHSLTQKKKEFMIYEATFSDVIGIMFFNFVVIQHGSIFSFQGMITILLTVIVSVLVSYFLVYLFGKITTQIKIFMMLAVLAALYGIGKQFHLSSLLIIFIFGLILNNTKQFFVWKLEEYVDFKKIEAIRDEFHTITAETAFLVRTFFFIAFGMSLDLVQMTNPKVMLIGSIIVVILYLIRYINFKTFLKTDVIPEIFLAPRGLITILLFYNIPAVYQIQDFSIGILSFVIVTTSLVMMGALIATPKHQIDSFTIVDIGVTPTNDLLVKEPEGPYCELETNEFSEENNSSKKIDTEKKD